MTLTAALKFYFETCVAMKFVDDDDDDLALAVVCSFPVLLFSVWFCRQIQLATRQLLSVHCAFSMSDICIFFQVRLRSIWLSESLLKRQFFIEYLFFFSFIDFRQPTIKSAARTSTSNILEEHFVQCQ